MKLSIVVPCYEEEKVIEQFYKVITETLEQEKFEYNLVLVNDGSKDNTLSILKALAQKDERVKYITFSRNFGKESAMLAGLSFSDGDVIIIMDADLQHPPSLIPKLVEGYHEGYDQVIAQRTRTGDSFGRTVLSRLYYKMINKLVDVKLVNGQGDFRLLSRRAVNALLDLNEYNRFSKGLFSWIGFKEKVIKYENVLRDAGESKWTFSKLLSYGIDGVISFNNKPLRISIYLGIITTVFAILYVFVSLVQNLIYGIDVPGYFTTIASILVLGGIQLLFLGVIGEYIGRIYYEIKRRPHYIIEEENVRKGEEVKEHVYTSRGY
ncbi:glycosyltransferase family 2 protein [Bacillus salitolerans]|uniref:Glycosyltransferase family 2 protein n=1 Tax=Bacillus salitolerans TaxID=1437434 RepID=A0ABW4LNT6_9BACI